MLQHLSTEEFSEKFMNSELGKNVASALETRVQGATFLDEALMERMQKWMKQKYRNSWGASLKLVVNREMLIWWRDKGQIRARVAQGNTCFK